MVFGVAFSVGMFVGQNLNGQRFLGNLKLLIAMPVSKGAFVLGSLLYASLSGIVTLVVLLGFGAAIDVGWDLTWGCFRLLLRCSDEGPDVVGDKLRSQRAGGQSRDRPVVAPPGAFSPVYYTIERCSARYAADGDADAELAVLAGFTVVAMAAPLATAGGTSRGPLPAATRSRAGLLDARLAGGHGCSART